MKCNNKLVALSATMVLAAVPAVALGAPPANHGTAHKPASPGPKASLPTKAKAYGRYCAGESKTHVKGVKGTPFSKCVTDMAKLAKGTTSSPRKACKDESKKHTHGTKGTPFSRCVSGGAKLKHDQKHPGDQYTDPFGS